MLDTKKIEDLLARFPEHAINDFDVDAFAEWIGSPVSDDLRAWLKMANRLTVPPHLFELPTRPDIRSILEIRPSWKTKKWIPIGDDGCGNYYVVATQQEFGRGFPVIFIDTIDSPESPAYVVASDAAHFVVFFLEAEIIHQRLRPEFIREYNKHGHEGRLIFPVDDPRLPQWPFNKDYVVARDPAILKFSKDLLPWEVDKKGRGD